MKFNRILLNTIAVYIKIIINTVITLISTRIVLQCLGVNDFGLYNLISGVVVLLSFLNGALMVSTQRYLSIAIGEKNNDKLSLYFNASLSIHAILAISLILVLFLLQPLLINYVLNIPEESNATAHIIYEIMVVSSALTLLQVPYSAAMNAHEDIYVWAITEALNCLLRLGAAVVLLFISSYKLEIYTALVFVALMISAGIKFVWCRTKYFETKLDILKMKNRAMIKEMFGFVGWNTLGSSAVLVRNQGVAILLNMFYGTIINAAYGIANQVNGLVMTLASTITTVFSPSIMQARGAGDNEKMIRVAILSSKISFLISSVTALPLLILMSQILHIWLGEVPQHTIEFCSLSLYVFMIMQLTAGLNRVIYAVGKIKWYQISISLILFSIIPVGYILFKMGFAVETIFYVMIVGQVFTLIANMYYSYKYVKYNIIKFSLQSVLLPFAIFLVLEKCASGYISMIEINTLNQIIIVVISMMVYVLAYIFSVFDIKERKQLFRIIK